MQVVEINDLFEQESPVGQLYVRLKELGIGVEREWWIDRKASPTWWNWPCPSKMGGCRLTSGIAPDRLEGCALRPTQSLRRA
jgi:hypothetical protein